MKKKLWPIVLFVSLLSLAFAPAVLAGSSLDIGDVPGPPPSGMVNWTAWHSGSLQPGGYPNQIMTEDSTNSSLGANQGYSNYAGSLHWILIVSNFNAPAAVPNVSTVTVLLGGLGAYSGSLWSSSFAWNTSTSSTDHGTATPFTGVTPCPSLTSSIYLGTKQTINWSGPVGTYYVYRSGNASGANNGASNGRYLYLATAATNSSGQGAYTDDYNGQAWYLVIHANSNGAIDGCHSEEASPTAVALANFNATAQPAVPSVKLTWQSMSEVDVLGFNLYRADTPAGDQLKLNADLIPALHPGEMLGDSYSYEDTTVQSGLTYYYWVEAVKQFGMSETQGPQMASFGYRFFLPNVQKN